MYNCAKFSTKNGQLSTRYFDSDPTFPIMLLYTICWIKPPNLSFRNQHSCSIPTGNDPIKTVINIFKDLVTKSVTSIGYSLVSPYGCNHHQFIC